MNASFARFCIRFLGCLFWVGVIFFFLFIPRYARFFQHKKMLHVFAWANMIDEKMLDLFEKESGIKVLMNYYESVEELFLKLHSTKAEGYDIVFTSDYIIKSLVDHGLLKKLAKEKLPFHRIIPELLGHYYDPLNEYSLPYEWSMYGLGINKKLCKKLPQASWRSIFDLPLPYDIGMLDEVRMIIAMAEYYIFQNVDHIALQDLPAIKALLLKQKPYVKAYTEVLGDYLVSSGTCPVVVAPNSSIWKVMKSNQDVTFLLPKEGCFLLIDNIVIPAKSNKDELVYAFLNYIYRPDVLKYHFERYAFFPAEKELLEMKRKEIPLLKTLLPTQEQLKNATFFKNIFPPKIMNELLIDLMS